jgi:hypothetical protein
MEQHLKTYTKNPIKRYTRIWSPSDLTKGLKILIKEFDLGNMKKVEITRSVIMESLHAIEQ